MLDQMDPEAGIEEEYKLKNDKTFTWKALRLMAKRDVSLLQKVLVTSCENCTYSRERVILFA